MGQSLDDLRSGGWMWDEMESGRFWEIWTLLDLSKVNGKAVLYAMPDMFVLILIVTLDYLLKLTSTKGDIRCEMNIQREMFVGGVENLLSGLLGGTMGYSQFNFNVLNFQITHNYTDKRPVFIMVLLLSFLSQMFDSDLPCTETLPRLSPRRRYLVGCHVRCAALLGVPLAQLLAALLHGRHSDLRGSAAAGAVGLVLLARLQERVRVHVDHCHFQRRGWHLADPVAADCSRGWFSAVCPNIYVAVLPRERDSGRNQRFRLPVLGAQGIRGTALDRALGNQVKATAVRRTHFAVCHIMYF